MKIVFPICKPSGKEFKNNAEIESILEAEHIGQYGYNYSNHSWHGGIHITDKSAPWAVDKYPVRAIADGRVVACRIGSKYQTSTFLGNELKFSNDFCLLEHEFTNATESGSEEKFTFYSLYMHLDPIGFHEQSAVVPRTLYKLNKRRYAREHPGLNGPKTTLHTNSLLELNEDESSVTIPPYTFRCYTMVDNAGNDDELAEVGTTLWVADDDDLFDILDEDVPTYPIPIWMYKKFKGQIICKSGLTIRGEPVGDKPGEKIGNIAKGGEFEFTVDSGFKTYGNYKMAKCTFLSGTKRKEGDGNSSTLSSGWIAIDDQFVTLTDRTPMELDTLHSLGSNSPISVKAGDPIGYLGRYDVIDAKSPKYLKTRMMVHFEQFSKTKPIESFIKQIFGDDKFSNVQYVIDENSDGFLDDTKNPPKFFDNLSSTVIDGGENVISNIEPWYASKYTVVKHESEWYARSGEKTIWDKMKALFDDILMGDIITHEKSRVDSLVWMQDESKIGFGKTVWNWWPIDKNTQIDVTMEMLKQVFTGIRGSSRDSFLQAIANDINEHAELYKLDTELRISHFFAQVREEAGVSCRVEESFNYSPKGLKSTFKYFRSRTDEANLYGRTSTHRANPEAIANRAYNGVSGNKWLGNGDITSGDGWKYRGRGLKQLTGKDNYSSFTDDYARTFPNETVSFIENPDLLLEAKYALRSAVYFWLTNNLYNIADRGVSKDSSNKITEVINQYTDSYDARFNHLKKIWSNHVFKEAF